MLIAFNRRLLVDLVLALGQPAFAGVLSVSLLTCTAYTQVMVPRLRTQTI
jgi:hypothetical protein